MSGSSPAVLSCRASTATTRVLPTSVSVPVTKYLCISHVHKVLQACKKGVYMIGGVIGPKTYSKPRGALGNRWRAHRGRIYSPVEEFSREPHCALLIAGYDRYDV